jgi:hypothetical protein
LSHQSQCSFLQSEDTHCILPMTQSFSWPVI